MRRELSANEGAAGGRLDVFLAANLSVTRSHGQVLLRGGHVRVNGQPERPSYLVQAGDKISVEEPETPLMPSETPPDLPIIYEDADLLVIDKPAGLVMHSGSGTAGRPTVADFARPRTTDPDADRPGIVHRLDRDTSGLVILAKTPIAKAFMQRQFRAHEVHKTYTLLAIGRVEPPEAVIRLPLARDPAHPLRRAVVAGGREAVTRYKTVANYPGYTLIEAKPESGRTHQLRVHLAAIGHPVAGDITYGPPRRTLKLKRQFLHAAQLEFVAPSGRRLSLVSPVPLDLAAILQTLSEPGIIKKS